MNSEWRTFKLGQLGRIVTGKTPKTSNANNFGGAIPFVTPTDMDGRKVIKQTGRCLTDLGASTVKNCVVPAGSIMVSCIGSDMGKSVIAGRQCVTNQQINTIVVDKEFCSEFVYYNLSIRKAELQHLAAGGSTMPILNKSVFSEIKIELPSIATQHEIVSVFGCLDEKIMLLRETNSTLEGIAQALFKSWFVDFDPVRAKMEGRVPEGIDEVTAALFPDEFEESELAVVPRGWSVRSLDEIANYLNGLALQKFPPTGLGDLPVIKIAQLRKGDTVGADMASRNMKPEYIVQDGDVLFSWSGSLEVEIWCGGEGALNQHLFKVTSNTYPKWFYYLWTRHHLGQFREVAASKATTMGHIQRGHLSAARVNVPSPTVLTAANNVLQPIFDCVIGNALQARHLESLRDTLLPRLISGQLRLPEIEAQIEAIAA